MQANFICLALTMRQCPKGALVGGLNLDLLGIDVTALDANAAVKAR